MDPGPNPQLTNDALADMVLGAFRHPHYPNKTFQGYKFVFSFFPFGLFGFGMAVVGRYVYPWQHN